ncbi:MAG: N-carbamoyl-D-amino acid hydrolase, putative, partial [uncultured Craurococcus sp.]
APYPPPRRRADGPQPAGRRPRGHPRPHGRAARGRGAGRGAARRLPGTRPHHLLPALAAGGGGARRLFRARHAEPAGAAALRPGARARHRLLCRLCGADAGRPALQQRHHHRAGWGGARQVPQGAPAGLGGTAGGRPLPATREALFRVWRSRLPRLPRPGRLGRAGDGHARLQRPPLAGGLARLRPAGRGADGDGLQLRGLRPEWRPDRERGDPHLPLHPRRAGQCLHERDLGGLRGEGGRRGRLRPHRRLLHHRPERGAGGAGEDARRRAAGRRLRPRPLPPGEGEDVQLRRPQAAGALPPHRRPGGRRAARL